MALRPPTIFNLLRSSDNVAHLEWENGARRYQRFAARCLEEARGTTDPRLKAFLAEMAQEWQRALRRRRAKVGNGNFEVPRKTLATRACLLETGSPRMRLPNNCCSFFPGIVDKLTPNGRLPTMAELSQKS